MHRSGYQLLDGSPAIGSNERVRAKKKAIVGIGFDVMISPGDGFDCRMHRSEQSEHWVALARTTFDAMKVIEMTFFSRERGREKEGEKEN